MVVPDNQASLCSNCYREFTWTFRKHHCRLCGRIFCKNCSSESNTRINNGPMQRVRLCNGCHEINSMFNQNLDKNKPLLMNNMQDNTDNYFKIVRRDTDVQENDQFSILQVSGGMNQDSITSEHFFNGFDGQSSDYQRRLSQTVPERRATIIEELRSDLAQKSNEQQDVIKKYLKLNHYGQDLDDPDQQKQQLNNSVNRGISQQEQAIKSSITQFYEEHLNEMVKLVMREYQIDEQKWFQIIQEYTKKTVTTVKPTSEMLNDSIDINEFVKIVTVYHPDQSKCRNVNGVIFKKGIANKHMRNNIMQPKILLLANSLGYVHEDGLALVDLGREIEQEDTLIQIIKQKIEQVNPDVIFVEKDASINALNMLLKENRTVITNTQPKMMLMISRLTQTIICPNSNFISKVFKIGECGQFKIEQLKGQDSTDRYMKPTSLLCLEGCSQQLGCSIVLSGPDVQELKRIRTALRKCIKLARSLLHESEYLKFTKPNINFLEDRESIAEGDDSFQFEELQKSIMTSTNSYSINNQQKISTSLDPFLFNKMMERQSLIFEYFSLAYPQKNNYDFEENDVGKSSRNNQVNNDLPDFGGRRMTDELRQENETEIKRKLKKMCNKPQRLKIDLYSVKNDYSVFTMIKRLAKTAMSNCQAESCSKPRLAHTDYWYHGNGCVEMKLKLMEESAKLSTSNIQKQLDMPQKVQIYVFCNKCQSMIIKKRNAPMELLEMSFFKFLEQFFYNQDMKTVLHNAHGRSCPHLFHIDSSFLFKYGPVKIMFQFELIQEYTLDLIHFGQTPGIFSPETIQRKVTDEFYNTIHHFEVSLQWIDQNCAAISSWLTDAQKDFTPIFGQEFYQMSKNLIAFVSEFEENFGFFMGQMTKLLKTRTEDNVIPIGQGLKRATQGGRISKLISERICEYIYILRKVQQYICDGLFTKFLAKKQTIQQYLAPSTPDHRSVDESFISVGRQSTKPIIQQLVNQQTRDFSSTHLIVNRQMHDFDDSTPLLKNLTLVENDLKSTNPLSQLRRDFKVIADFENSLVNNESIKQITSYCAYFSLGFNQGSVRVKPFDFTSLIAMTLNSNLYLTGLAQMDYMEMNEKIQAYSQTKIDVNTKSGELFAGTSKLLEMSHSTNSQQQQSGVVFKVNQDVLNQHVAFALAEAELSKPTDWEMLLEFSTSHKESLRIEKEGQEMLISEEQGNVITFFDRNEPITQLGPYLEQPVSNKLFDSLSKVITQSSLYVSQVQRMDKSAVDKNSENSNKQTVSSEQAKSDIYHLFHDQFEFTVKVYFPGHFEALRKIYCGGYSDFIQSFTESEYWKDNSGGKSRSTFFMSSDQKYVLKAVKGSEVKMFEDMSGSYFEYLKESFARQCPSTIAKTLGIFKIKIRLEKQSRSEQFYLLLMENLLLHSNENCVRYDLKGSRRNRYISKKSPNEVTLDNNFLQDMKSRPIPLQYSMKRLLTLAIHNDSLYLSKQSIIDYSMFVIIDKVKRTVRLGIIDYNQQYNFEKTLESFVKSNLSSEEPTIIQPEAYKQRFRVAMDKYFVAMIPDKDTNVQQLMNNLFKADKIQWFTKETDKSVV